MQQEAESRIKWEKKESNGGGEGTQKKALEEETGEQSSMSHMHEGAMMKFITVYAIPNN